MRTRLALTTAFTLGVERAGRLVEDQNPRVVDERTRDGEALSFWPPERLGFLAAAGVDPNTQVTELAWALVPGKATTDNGGGSIPTTEQIVGVALGDFRLRLGLFHVQKSAHGENSNLLPVRICGFSTLTTSSSFSSMRIPRRLASARNWRR